MFQGSCSSHLKECGTPSCGVGRGIQKKDEKEQKLGEKNGRHFGSVFEVLLWLEFVEFDE